MHRSTRWLLVPLTVLGLVGAACGSSASKTAATTAVSAVKGDTTVFAASSLTAAFNEVGASFTTTNP
jgi:molybdate transport system substrate-binding protein